VISCTLSELSITDRALPSVVVPPRWTVEPTDASVASGQDVTLHCQADGYPVPSITWRKAVGTSSHVILYYMLLVIQMGV
jgi:hypothetical protein